MSADRDGYQSDYERFGEVVDGKIVYSESLCGAQAVFWPDDEACEAVGELRPGSVGWAERRRVEAGMSGPITGGA